MVESWRTHEVIFPLPIFRFDGSLIHGGNCFACMCAHATVRSVSPVSSKYIRASSLEYEPRKNKKSDLVDNALIPTDRYRPGSEPQTAGAYGANSMQAKLSKT